MLRASRTARLAVCSQAPGTRVHASGTPFTDRSGDRLRDWMGVTPQEFYDEARVAIVPMGFCFPGQDEKGGDLPPRRECATTLASQSCSRRCLQIELVLAVGTYAQNFHLGDEAGASLQETMLDWRRHLQRQASPARPAAAPSLLAQQCLADTQSLVRGRASAGSAARGAQAARERGLALRRKIIY